MAKIASSTPGPRAVNAPAHLTADRRAPASPGGDAPPRRAPRRRFLLEAGATIALSLGATAAVLAPDPTWATPAAAEPDAELLAACAEFDRLDRSHGAIVNAAKTSAEEEEADRLVSAMEERWQAALDAVCSLRATTVAGHRARAASLALFVGGSKRMEADAEAGGYWDERLCAALVRDLVGEVPA